MIIRFVLIFFLITGFNALLHRISYKSIPKQVHLALTGNPNEMSITWITFHDKRYPKGVETFVDYWEYKNKKATLKSVTAEKTKYKYSDKIVGYCYSESNDFFNYTNIRYIHKVVLKGLVEHKRYEYQVGYYIPSKINGTPCVAKKFEYEKKSKYLCKKQNRNKIFNFVMFPWTNNNGDIAFTIAIVGNMRLKDPNVKIKFFEKYSNYDKLSPDALRGLIELVHRDTNPKHSLLYKTNHPIYSSHLNTNSSGIKMQNVQLILHIDASSDFTKYVKHGKNCDEVYNYGDRFMSIIEEIAAYVPYHVIAGNSETAFETKYDHFESRFAMPFSKHLNNHYYYFTVGPIFFVCINTEFYYSPPTNVNLKLVQKQYEFINKSLNYANTNRQQFPWLVVVQYQPFYCSSINNDICRANKFHKNGIPDPKNPQNKLYGLEELFNKYNVDLVLSGNENEFEMFPPIELHDKMNKFIPYKYWWEAKRFVNNDKNTETLEHVFKDFRDPIAPTYVDVGKPGDYEGIEVLTNKIKKHKVNPITLLHYPGSEAKKSLIAIRQVDVNNGYVPLEFALEKTFFIYNKNEICTSINEGIENKYQLQTNSIIHDRKANKKALKDTTEYSINEYFNLKENENDHYFPSNNENKEGKILLLKEIDTTASENSKIRALLNAYNLNKEYPWDTQLNDFYKTAKLQVCGIVENNVRLKVFDMNKENEKQRIKTQFRTNKQVELTEQNNRNTSHVNIRLNSEIKFKNMGGYHNNSNLSYKSEFQFSPDSQPNGQVKSALKKTNNYPTNMQFESKYQIKVKEKDDDNVKKSKIRFDSHIKFEDVEEPIKSSNIRLDTAFQFSAGSQHETNKKEERKEQQTRLKKRKNVSFSKNKNKIDLQNFNQINENKENGQLKNAMKKTSTIKTNETENNVSNQKETKIQFDSPMKFETIKGEQKSSKIKFKYKTDLEQNMRVETKFKVENIEGNKKHSEMKYKTKLEVSPNDLRFESTTKFSYNTQKIEGNKNKFDKKIEWENDDLLHFANLFAYFYLYGMDKNCRDKNGWPTFKLFKLSYDEDNKINYFHLDANEAIKIIKNKGKDCVMIHYVKDSYEINYGTLLHNLFAKKGIEITETIEFHKHAFVPLSIVLRKMQQFSVEGNKFFERNAHKIEVTEKGLIDSLLMVDYLNL
ncbi:Purple acid phosphatase [Meloidogyne graminicola]|nr:Purple acid phosphatase [Meloidogyne graminicola]